jgi:hypothetical protein
LTKQSLPPYHGSKQAPLTSDAPVHRHRPAHDHRPLNAFTATSQNLPHRRAEVELLCLLQPSQRHSSNSRSFVERAAQQRTLISLLSSEVCRADMARLQSRVFLSSLVRAGARSSQHFISSDGRMSYMPPSVLAAQRVAIIVCLDAGLLQCTACAVSTHHFAGS